MLVSLYDDSKDSVTCNSMVVGIYMKNGIQCFAHPSTSKTAYMMTAKSLLHT